MTSADVSGACDAAGRWGAVRQLGEDQGGVDGSWTAMTTVQWSASGHPTATSMEQCPSGASTGAGAV